MKATVKQCIILILCAALTAAGLPAFAAGNDPDPAALIPLSFSETVDYINEHAPDTDSEETIGYACWLAGKMKDAAPEKIEAALLDPDNCDAARVAVMLVAADLSLPLTDETVASLLDDRRSCESLRAYALDWLSQREPMDTALFARIAGNGSDPQAGWALKLLYLRQPEAARPLLDEALADIPDGPLDSRVSTAFLYKGYDLNLNGSAEEIAAFLLLCEKTLQNLPAQTAEDEDDPRAAVFYAIANAGSMESVSYLFAREGTDGRYLWAAVQYAGEGVVYRLYDSAADKTAFAKKMRAANHPLLGDMDGDDALTPQDARTVLRQAVKKDPVSREGEWDLDGDGILTPQDARLTLRTASGLEKPLFMGLPPRFSGDTA